MESTRQSKVAKQIQKDISDIFTKEAADLVRGVMVTVTSVEEVLSSSVTVRRTTYSPPLSTRSLASFSFGLPIMALPPSG